MERWREYYMEGGLMRVAAIAIPVGLVALGAISVVLLLSDSGNAGADGADVLGATIESPAIIIDVAGNPGIDPRSVAVLTAPALGEATAAPNGTILYRGPFGVTGGDSFQYQACTQAGGCFTGTITIALQGESLPLVTAAPPGIIVRDVNGNLVAPSNLATAPPTPVGPIGGGGSGDSGDDATTTTSTTEAGDTTTTSSSSTTSTTFPSFPTTTIADTTTSTTTSSTTTTTTQGLTLPIAINDLAGTAEDSSVVIVVTANDLVDSPTGLTVTIASAPANGTAVVALTSVQYTPNSNFNGADGFDYQVCDAEGDCDIGHVDVVVTPVNDAPTAGDDTKATSPDKSVQLRVLGNDVDVDGDEIFISTFDATSTLGGTITIDTREADDPLDDILIYTPPAGWDGTSDTFTYTVSDGNGGSAVGTVTITLKT